ncbi:MAG: hypothetical protein ACI85H_000453, partial [Paracoccaceae bacterium]
MPEKVKVYPSRSAAALSAAKKPTVKGASLGQI